LWQGPAVVITFTVPLELLTHSQSALSAWALKTPNAISEMLNKARLPVSLKIREFDRNTFISDPNSKK
jgi:hypothetical protein